MNTKTFSYSLPIRQNHSIELRTETVGYFLLALIVATLLIYITSLNISISDTFRSQKIQRDLALERQELQSRKDYFNQTLAQYFESHSSDFTPANPSNETFVSRGGANVAQAPTPYFR